MPYAKGSQSNKKTTREDTIREEDLDHESEPVARDVITSPLSSASSYSSVSGSASSVGSGSGGSSVSSDQLELILRANNQSMEASMRSLISTLSPAVPVAPTPSAAPSPPVKVPKWSDGDQPFSFFNKLETALTHNGVDKATWGRLLPVYLSGDAESAFAEVDRSLLGDYDAVKRVLLKALGDTPAHADRRWWSLARLPGEEPAQFYLRIRNTGLRRLSDFPTRDAVVDQTILSRFLSLLPADSYTAVTSQHPKTGLEAAGLLQEFEETKAYSWKRQGWRHSHHSGRREPSWGSSGNGGGRTNSSNDSNSGSGVKEVTGSDNSSPPSASGAGSPRGGGDRMSKKPIICHGCGEPGHIRPQCPMRVRSVRSLDSESPAKGDKMFVSGWIGGSPVEKLKIDTGADRSLVRKDLVPPTAYTGEVVNLVTWKGNDPSKHNLAKVAIRVGDMEVLATMAVVEQLDCPALLGPDMGDAMTRHLLKTVLTNMDVDNVSVEVPMQLDIVNSEVTKQVVQSEVVRVTRAQAEKARKEEVANELTSANSGSEPLALADIFDFEDEFFDDDKSLPDPNVLPTPLHELEGLVDGVEVDLPLPKLSKGDGNSLCREQKADPTLKAQWLLAEVRKKDVNVKVEVPMQIEPEVACEAPEVALEEIFCFSDSLFEPEVACDAPAVAMDDIFCLSVSPFEPEEAGEASVVALEDIFWPDLGEVEFSLPVLDDDVLEASVAPACSDTFVVPRQLTAVDDGVLEVLEASVAPVGCSNIVVPRHLEEVKDEVLEAGVASVDSVKIVVPMQQVVVTVDLAVDWVAPADAVSDPVSDTVGDYFNLPEEFFVEDQADVVASGPVDCKPMVGLDVADLVDSLSETDPVLAPVPIAGPEPEKVVIVVILAMEDSIPPKLCWQSPTVLVDHCLRFMCCDTKATGKFAPGSCTVILVFDMFILVISTICSFCSCISMCLSKFLVVLFFGAFGPRAVPLLPGLDDPPWRMLGAPSVSWILDWLGFSLLHMRASPLPLLPRPLVSRKGGGDVMESPSPAAAAP